MVRSEGTRHHQYKRTGKAVVGLGQYSRLYAHGPLDRASAVLRAESGRIEIVQEGMEDKLVESDLVLRTKGLAVE